MKNDKKTVILDGRAAALEIRSSIRDKVANDKKVYGSVPGLAEILVGSDPASLLYVNMKRKASSEAGFYTVNHHLPEWISEQDVISIVENLNANSKIHGILIQLPLPSSININKVMGAIDYRKDVDGFNPYNMGRLAVGDPLFVPCTPLGVIELMSRYNISLKGKDAIIVGAGTITGRPLASMMLNLGATVQICHILTKNLADKVRAADIVVSAAGHPDLITGDMIKEGAVVIDVGISKINGKISGDVLFDEAVSKASFITPVPGGVGPMTIAMLLKNSYKAFKLSFESEKQR